ncbi:MAG TPA: hypothetical protein PLI77_01455 [Bacteroidales bacterium]|nr:hypothetical protein [Bacteroidales bacterium]
MNNLISLFFRFVVFVGLQVLVFNNIRFIGFINPQIYLIPLLLLPLDMKKWIQYIIAFATGLAIDIFTSVYGIHSLASLMLIFVRPYFVFFINGFKPNDGIFKPLPGSKDFKWLFVYVSGLSFLHQLLVSFLETFNMSQFFYTLWVAIVNTFFTVILILCVEYLFYNKKK